MSAINEYMKIEHLSDQNISIVPEQRKSIDSDEMTPAFNEFPEKKHRKNVSEVKNPSYLNSVYKNVNSKARAKMVGISAGASSGLSSADAGSKNSVTMKRRQVRRMN
jgi:hypothetical protein